MHWCRRVTHDSASRRLSGECLHLTAPGNEFWQFLEHRGSMWKLVDLVEVDVRWCEASGSTVMPEQLQQAWLREFHAAKDIGHFPMLHRDHTMHSEILVILCRWVCLAFLLALLLLPASQGFHVTRIFLIGHWFGPFLLEQKKLYVTCAACELWAQDILGYSKICLVHFVPFCCHHFSPLRPHHSHT